MRARACNIRKKTSNNFVKELHEIFRERRIVLPMKDFFLAFLMRLLRRKRHVSRDVSAVTRNVLLDVNSNALSVINVYNQLKVVAVKDVHRLGGV